MTDEQNKLAGIRARVEDSWCKHARTDIPYLLALVAAKEERIAELTKFKGQAIDWSAGALGDYEQLLNRNKELEAERDEWQQAFNNLQTLTVKARNLVGGKGEWRNCVPSITDVTNVDTPRAEAAEFQVSSLREALRKITVLKSDERFKDVALIAEAALQSTKGAE